MGRNRIYAAIAGGGLCGVKVGKRLAIDAADLDLWVRRGCPITADQQEERPAVEN